MLGQRHYEHTRASPGPDLGMEGGKGTPGERVMCGGRAGHRKSIPNSPELWALGPLPQSRGAGAEGPGLA